MSKKNWHKKSWIQFCIVRQVSDSILKSVGLKKNGIGKKDLGSRHILLWLLENIFDHDDDANNRLSDGELGGLVQTMLFQVIPFNSPPLSLSEVSQRR